MDKEAVNVNFFLSILPSEFHKFQWSPPYFLWAKTVVETQEVPLRLSCGHCPCLEWSSFKVRLGKFLGLWWF